MNYHFLLVGLLCLLIFTAGCSALDKNQGTDIQHEEFFLKDSQSSPAGAPAQMQGGSESVPERSRSGEDIPIPQGGDILSELDQKIIKTANLQIEVPDVQKTAHDIAILSESENGIVQSSSVTAGQNDHYSGTVIVRIPSSRFDNTLTTIKNFGKVISSSISAEDASERYVDLAAQKTALSNQLDQYNHILTRAVNVSEILEVQREIERVQIELDRITGRLKYLDNRISYSTITVQLSEPAQVVTTTGYSFASVISEGISGFAETLVWLVVMIMTLLPLIIIGVMVYLLFCWIKIRKKEKL
jgi:hypothetical protein